MESGSQQACLLGPWDEVFTPVPSAKPSTREWHVRKADTPATDTCHYPLVFPDSLYSTYNDLRWLHWLRQNPQHFAQMPDSELPRVVSNLDFLVKHSLGVDRDLLQLSALITEGELRETVRICCRAR